MLSLPLDLSQARRWLNRQLWQQESSAAFFDPLLERMNPLWVYGQSRAKVVATRDETPDTRTFTLCPNNCWKGFEAGQHCTVTADIDGVRESRTFSLSSSPELFTRDGLISFTIKRIEGGKVTPWLHRSLKTGAVVGLSRAFGDFTLPEEPKPLFYLVGGSGITPVLSHLQSLAAQQDLRPIALVYLVRDLHHVIARERLQALEQALPGLKIRLIHTRERTSTPKLSAADLRAVTASLAGTESYLCGPGGLIERALPLLQEAGAQPESVRQALFNAPRTPMSAQSGGSLIRCSTGQTLTGDGETTLLELAEKAGLNPTYGCRQGICRQCACKKTSGRVLNRLTGRLSGDGEETIQPCISLPHGPVTVEL